MRRDLLRWQHELYPDGHADRTNLMIHLVTVPMFQMGFLTFLIGLVGLSGVTILTGWTMMFVCIVLQGKGHRRETTAPVPFDGAFDVVSRLLVEQWITFPRFVLGGGFVKAWQDSQRSP